MRGELVRARHRIFCICGSTRFKEEIAAERARLTLEGIIVVGPEVLVRSDPSYSDLHESEAKDRLDELHLRKIDLADEVLVVNPGGYIGQSTEMEIRYARLTGKHVSFTDGETCPKCGRKAGCNADCEDLNCEHCYCYRDGRDE